MKLLLLGMPKVTFYGASKEVTGSCYLVEGKDTKIVVDCGLFQGGRFSSKKNSINLPFACGEIDNVLVTHAHLDHTGRIPRICMEGFTGKIYATKPTLEIVDYLWQDALEIMEIDYQEHGRLPLYSPEQAKKTITHFHGVNYKEKIQLKGQNYAIFHDAGHILGSAFIELIIDGKRLVFSGDVGNVDPPIIKETSPLPFDIDLLICESTYGDRNHEGRDEREQALLSMVQETAARHGTLMIPAFAIERTQEILYHLNTLVEEKQIPRMPIFLDSPLAIEVTSVFKKYPGFYNQEDLLVQNGGDDLFEFEGLEITKTRKQSIKINKINPPKIIIAGSGMMSGGRIMFHLQRYLSDERNTLFIVGYQANRTLGRKILDGAKEVHIFRSTVPVRAHVHAIGAFSAHADQKKLLSWIGASKNLKQVYLVHGEEEKMQIFSKKIKEKLKLDANLAVLNQTIEV